MDARTEVEALYDAARRLEEDSVNADNDFLANDMVREANKLRRRAAKLEQAEQERQQERA